METKNNFFKLLEKPSFDLKMSCTKHNVEGKVSTSKTLDDIIESSLNYIKSATTV